MVKIDKKYYSVTVRVGVELKKIIDDLLTARRGKSPKKDIRQSEVLRELILEGSKTLTN